MRSSITSLFVAALVAVSIVALPGASAGAAGTPVADVLPTEALAVVADLDAAPRSTGWLAGEALTVTGTVGIHDRDAQTTTPVATPLQLRVDNDPARALAAVAGVDGTFQAVVPGALTEGLAPGVHSIWVSAADLGLADTAVPAARFTTVASADGEVVLRHQFVSSTGWIKPADEFPITTRVQNFGPNELTDLTVSIAAPDSVTFADATPLQDGSTATVTAATVTWAIPSVPAGTVDAPGEVVLVTQAQSADLDADPELVWKDLSSVATLTGAGDPLSEATHGPKVIPPSGAFESARYGDKPFPIVPVSYVDRAPQADNDTAELDTLVNSPDFEGSTFNLYQEMSYGQLFPFGTVPSAGIDSATYSELDETPTFTTAERVGTTCRGVTLNDVPGAIGSPVYDTRIENGWYKLPGTTEYYGGDFPVFDLGTASSIDSACGQAGKAVYDAAAVADPEIDYNTYDSDRDGVVDFFMLVFVGCGGNGGSQIPLPGTPVTNELCPYTDAPYDNIWPHSSSLIMQYRDEATGLRGYVSHDQLRSVTEIPQCFLDDTYTAYDDCAANGGPGDDAYPVPVRVGPYNVNPETVFESTSVIAHEYGHHLGLPDYYNSSGFSAYDTWNLMAADHNQHMTVFSKQQLGWVVPRYLNPGDDVTVEDWGEIKTSTGEIHWETPDGTPYVLSEANGDQNIVNGDVWAAKLPQREVISPEQVAEEASGTKVLWSRRGDDFGCPNLSGNNIDLLLPELADVDAGSTVTLSFRSSFDIEWDWDYGFVQTTTDGQTYQSHASASGYSTDSVYNPNGAACLDEINNGLTGQSGAYEQGEPFITLARNPAAPDYATGTPFVDDSYDISNLAGTNGVVRFSMFTDAAFNRPGWFIDDVVVSVDGTEVYSTDFEDGLEEGRWFNGGCDEDLRTGPVCTNGFVLIDTSAGDASDHAYYLELRDRALFDFEGYGQNDRGTVTWQPGLLVEYTDENHGYGNNGLPDPPGQHYLDSQPVAGAECGDADCDDAAFTDADGDDRFSDSSESPHLDNFADPDGIDGRWTFDYDCLDVEVLSMDGEDTVQLEADLVADVRLRAGDGCREFSPADTAEGAGTTDLPAEAVIGRRAGDVEVGDTVTFDGSASSGNLPITWDWDLGDGTTADTETVNHSYAAAGTYTVTLVVTDADGDVDDVSIEVVVVDAPEGTDSPLPATGGGMALAALALMGVAKGVRRRR